MPRKKERRKEQVNNGYKDGSSKEGGGQLMNVQDIASAGPLKPSR